MLKDFFSALKKLLLLEERVRALSEQQRDDHDLLMDCYFRLVRIEAYLDVRETRREGGTAFFDPQPRITDEDT